MSIQLYHPYPFPKRQWMAASLLGRSGGHPIHIVLPKRDIPDDVRKTEKQREETKRQKKEYNIISSFRYCILYIIISSLINGICTFRIPIYPYITITVPLNISYFAKSQNSLIEICTKSYLVKSSEAFIRFTSFIFL